MEYKAIIEKGSDGLHSVRLEEYVNDCLVCGYGENVEEAKQDFLECLQETLGTDLTGISIEYQYDLPSFFNYFDLINASKLAKKAGINESKMRQYKCGAAFPSEATTAKILAAVHQIGSELTKCAI